MGFDIVIRLGKGSFMNTRSISMAVQPQQQLNEIAAVLRCLTHPQEKVEVALDRLSSVLMHCVEAGDVDVRNSCFSAGIVKAVLGILRSCGEVSTLAIGARCLGLLVHANDEARGELGELGAIPVLVKLLVPRPRLCSDGASGPLWPREWVPVYKESLVCLRKLTFFNHSNQQALAREGGVKLVIEMSQDQGLFTNYGQFPAETKVCLEELVTRKRFVSRVCAVAEEERAAVLRSFPALDLLGSMHYPAFYVELTTEDRQWVSHSLLEKGVVWPTHRPVPEGCKWTNVVVQCVESGCDVWCQFCTHKPNDAAVLMNKSLLELAPPDPSSGLDPTLGDVYAAFCLPPAVPHQPTPRQQWLRARVLTKGQGVKGQEVTALAVDYGFTITIAQSSLHVLPSQCRGVPPLAVPCRLHDVSPLPASVSLLENAAGVIRNMAFEMLSFRKEIQTFRGVECMVKLAQSPDQDIVLQALGGLLNMTVSEVMREEVGKKGAVKVAIGLVEECSRGVGCVDVLEYSLGLLANCASYCSMNVHLLSQLGGEAVLRQLQYDERALTSPDQRERIPELVKELLRYLSFSCGSKTQDKQPLANGSSREASHQSKKEILYRARLLANGERSQSKPVIRHISTHDGQPTQHDQVLASPALPGSDRTQQDKLLFVDSHVSTLPSLQCDSMVQCHCYLAPDITQFTTKSLERSICALMNGQKGGRVYLGVNKGVVKGTKISKKQRDTLCVCVDELMSSAFTPSIHAYQYKVRFIPVAEQSPFHTILDYCVVEITLMKSEHHQIYTLKEKDMQGFTYSRCYHQPSVGHIESLSHQELRDLVAKEDASSYATEVMLMQRGVKQFKQAAA